MDRSVHLMSIDSIFCFDGGEIISKAFMRSLHSCPADLLICLTFFISMSAFIMRSFSLPPSAPQPLHPLQPHM